MSLKKNTPNAKLAALLLTFEPDNIKLAFELAEAAKCPFFLAFKKKYVTDKPKWGKLGLKLKLFRFLNFIRKHSPTKVSVSFIADSLIPEALGIRFIEETFQISKYKFHSAIDYRLNKGKTIRQESIDTYKDNLKYVINTAQSRRLDEVPF